MKRECACRQCVRSCRTNTGWFKPGEAERVAVFLGVTLEELLRTKMVIDYWVGGARVLAPARQGDEPGEVLPYESVHCPARCVFLTDDDRCGIHEVKPYECAQAMGCQGNTAHADGTENVRDEIQRAWDEIGDPYRDGEDDPEGDPFGLFGCGT